jgi:hypothetical protein
MNTTLKSPPKATSIAERVIAYIAKVPPAVSGQRGHDETIKLTQTLVNGFCLSQDEALHYLETYYNPGCVPPWSRSELVHKVNEAISKPLNKPRGWMLEKDEWKPNRLVKLPKKKVVTPPVDTLANMKKFVGDFRCTEQEVIKASPLKVPQDPFRNQGAMMVEHLFEADDLVNIMEHSTQDKNGKWSPKGYGKTLPRAEWVKRLLEPRQEQQGGVWICMNPVNGEGISEANITGFKYALLEFDEAPKDMQLSWLAKIQLPIAAIVWSGGKSYHAWAKIDAKSLAEFKTKYDSLYEFVKKYGADKTPSPTRKSRLAGVMRGDQQQRLIYLNPDADQKGGIL